MATSTSGLTAMTLMPISEQIVHGNHVLWKAQVLAVLHRAQLTGFLDGTNPTPIENTKIKNSKADEDSEEVPNAAYEHGRLKNSKFLATC
jgi:hypothetical protein